MALFTEKEIEAIMKRVFPAAEIDVWEEFFTGPYDDLIDVPPGDWIDRIEQEVSREEDEHLDYRLVARLNAVLGVDTLGRHAFVPTDYAERYGWPRVDVNAAPDIYDDRPIDNVPPDDVINPEWALGTIYASFPEATVTTDDSGTTVLDPDVYWVGDDAGEFVFTNDIDDAVDRDLRNQTQGATLWEREQNRMRRLHQVVKKALDGTDRALSVADRVAGVVERMKALNLLEDEEEEALRLAEIHLRSPAERPLREILAAGESATAEFKLTARSEYPTGERSEKAEAEMVRAVAAFMNSRGGVLVVGVRDNASPIGIDCDLKRVKGRYDTLILNVGSKLEAALGVANVSMYVTVGIVEYDPAVLTIRVSAAQKRVYAKINNQECFCVRTGPATRELQHSEAAKYIEEHWGRGASHLSDDE